MFHSSGREYKGIFWKIFQFLGGVECNHYHYVGHVVVVLYYSVPRLHQKNVVHSYTSVTLSAMDASPGLCNHPLSWGCPEACSHALSYGCFRWAMQSPSELRVPQGMQSRSQLRMLPLGDVITRWAVGSSSVLWHQHLSNRKHPLGSRLSSLRHLLSYWHQNTLRRILFFLRQTFTVSQQPRTNLTAEIELTLSLKRY